jgi:hypothetical protein
MIVNYKNKYKKYKMKYLNLKGGSGVQALTEGLKIKINEFSANTKSICLSYLIHKSIDELNATIRGISPNPFTRLIINCPINVDTLNADKLTILQSITTVLYDIDDLPPMEFLKKLPNLKYLIFSNKERTSLEDLKDLKDLEDLEDFKGLNELQKLQEIIFKNSNNSTNFKKKDGSFKKEPRAIMESPRIFNSSVNEDLHEELWGLVCEVYNTEPPSNRSR